MGGYRRGVAQEIPLSSEAADLVATARDLGDRTEQLRRQTLDTAAQRAQVALRLHTDHGMSIARVAAALGITKTTAQQMLARAKAAGPPR